MHGTGGEVQDEVAPEGVESRADVAVGEGRHEGDEGELRDDESHDGDRRGDLRRGRGDETDEFSAEHQRTCPFSVSWVVPVTWR